MALLRFAAIPVLSSFTIAHSEYSPRKTKKPVIKVGDIGRKCLSQFCQCGHVPSAAEIIPAWSYARAAGFNHGPLLRDPAFRGQSCEIQRELTGTLLPPPELEPTYLSIGK